MTNQRLPGGLPILNAPTKPKKKEKRGIDPLHSPTKPVTEPPKKKSNKQQVEK